MSRRAVRTVGCMFGNRSTVTPRPAAVALAALTAAVLSAAPAAHADSIVFVRDANVWLAAPDGSRLHQVTTDGTAESPYRSPSQADDGTIAVSHGVLIKRLRQNGEVVSTIDPPALTDSTSHLIDGTPISVAISPDGSKVAWSVASYSCPIVWECGARGATGVTWADRFTPASEFSQSTYVNPRWIGNQRLLVTGGYLHHINTIDIAPGSTPVHWFDDQNYFYDSNDMGEGVVSRDGRRVAAVHGYDGDREATVRKVIWLNTPDARSGPPPTAIPDPVCATGAVRGTHSPTWSPDGTGLAFAQPDGVHVARNVPTDGTRCGEFGTTLALPGASEPDWGPADVAPTPRTPGPDQRPGPRDPQPQPRPQPRPSGRDGGKTTVRLAGAARLRAALRDGLKVRVAGFAARKRVTVAVGVDRRTALRLRLGRKAVRVGQGSARASAGGEAVVRVRFTPRAAKALRRQRTVTVSLTAPGGAKRTVTLR